MHGNNKSNSSIWWIILGAVPLAILLFSGGKVSSGGYLWPIIIVGLTGGYFWMMLRGQRSQNHDGHGDAEGGDNAANSTGAAQGAHEEHKNDKPKHHGGGGGCCH